MARLESKTVQVHPKNEQSTISQMERFGWELKNAQDIVTKDSHEELVGDTVYSVTETERYIKLMFQRDKDGENYDLYVKGESLYNEILELDRKSKHYKFSFRLWPEMKKWKYILIAVLCFFIGGGIGTTLAKSSGGLFIGWLIALALVAAAIIFYRIKFVRPKEKAIHDKLEVAADEAKELLVRKEAELKALGF